MGTYAQPITPVAQAQRTREQAARDRAQAKAHEQARAGNLPTLLRSTFTGDAIREVWGIGSRTQGGMVYTVDLCRDLAGISTLCDCAASDAERICWHRAAVRLASDELIPYHNPTAYRMRSKVATVRQPAPARLDQYALTGRRRSA